LITNCVKLGMHLTNEYQMNNKHEYSDIHIRVCKPFVPFLIPNTQRSDSMM